MRQLWSKVRKDYLKYLLILQTFLLCYFILSSGGGDQLDLSNSASLAVPPPPPVAVKCQPKLRGMLSYYDFARTDFNQDVPQTQTHMAFGVDKRAGDLSVAVHYQRKLIRDPILIKSDNQRAGQFLEDVTNTLKNTNPSLTKGPIDSVINRGNILPTRSQMFLNYWYQKIPANDPMVFFKKELVEYQQNLQLLTQRHFPKKSHNNKCYNCFPMDFNYMITPNKNLCNGARLIVLTTSIPKSTLERKAVRESWGQWTKMEDSPARLIFLFGDGWSKDENKILSSEAQIHGDILQADYMDHYYNLTYKVIMGYKWVLKNCPKTDFIMRAADDTFVHLPNLSEFLETHGDKPQFQDYQVGYCLFQLKAPRFPWFKNHLTTNDFQYDMLPPYAMGSTFLTSYNLTRDIVEASPNIPYFPVEDIYFGLLAPSINSGCTHTHGFLADQGVEGYNYKVKSYFASHLENPDRLRLIYKHIHAATKKHLGIK